MRLCFYTSSESTDRGVFAMASSSGATFTVESCVSMERHIGTKIMEHRLEQKSQGLRAIK